MLLATNSYVMSLHYLLIWKFNTFHVLHIKSVPFNLSPLGLQSGCRSSLWRQQPFPQNTVCIPETLSNPCKQHSSFGKQKPQKNIISLSDPKTSFLPSLFLSYANEWHLFSLLVFPLIYWKRASVVTMTEFDCRQPLIHVHILLIFWHSETLNSQPLQCPLAT